jgi:hypothetical protein
MSRDSPISRQCRKKQIAAKPQSSTTKARDRSHVDLGRSQLSGSGTLTITPRLIHTQDMPMCFAEAKPDTPVRVRTHSFHAS